MINVLDFSSICDKASALETIYIVKNIFQVIKVGVPIGLIIFSMIDVLKMVMAANQDQISQGGKIVKRMFSAALIFFVVTVIDLSLNIVGQTNLSSSQCWNDATKELVEAKYEAEKAERLSQEEATKNSLKAQQEEELENAQEYGGIKTIDEINAETPGYNALSNGAKLINYAKQFVGNRYEYGGMSLTNGIDCSGFVQAVYKEFGYSLPRVTTQQCQQGTVVNGISNAKPGDIFCYGATGLEYHVALYAGILSNGDGESSGVADGTKAVLHASNSAAFPQGGIKFSSANYKTPSKIVRIFS